jgi:hypothetical protein
LQKRKSSVAVLPQGLEGVKINKGVGANGEELEEEEDVKISF